MLWLTYYERRSMYVYLLLAANTCFYCMCRMPEQIGGRYVKDDPYCPDTAFSPRSSVKRTVTRREWKTIVHWKHFNHSKDAPQPATYRHHAEILVPVGESNGGRRHAANRCCNHSEHMQRPYPHRRPYRFQRAFQLRSQQPEREQRRGDTSV